MRILGIIYLLSSLFLLNNKNTDTVIEGDFLLLPTEIDRLILKGNDTNEVVLGCSFIPQRDSEIIYGDSLFDTGYNNWKDLKSLRSFLIEASTGKITKCIHYWGERREVEYHKIRLKFIIRETVDEEAYYFPNFCKMIRIREPRLTKTKVSKTLYIEEIILPDKNKTIFKAFNGYDTANVVGGTRQ